ncbi:MAG TPA: carboxypeptidase-like regulatory domain-containing protein [Chthonomonadaceae bacterium]|nr:carboxypeptidase-like regulatory domain-containing protein [Chthonomonadaceae bacterium]
MSNNRYRRPQYSVLLFSALFLFGFRPHGAIAQPPQDKNTPLEYIKPTGRKPFQVVRIEGQTVFAAPGAKGESSATGVRITLFRSPQASVATISSKENGRFAFQSVAPGDYTLIVGADGLQPLSIPIQVEADHPQNAAQRPALLLHLRQTEDKRNSFVTPITNPALRAELLQMVKEDQDIRNTWIQHGVDHPDKAIEDRMSEIDAHNLERMKEIVRQYRWPGPDLVGVDGSEAAFLLVQHAQLTFQKEMLPHVRRAYRAGQLQGQDYALLLDRVLVGEGKPQVYGTQAKPIAEWNGQEPTLYPIQDEANVDKRRAEVGLFPLAEYRKMMKEMYFPQKQQKDKP